MLAEPALVLQQVPRQPSSIALDPRGELVALSDDRAVVVLRHHDRSVVARLPPFRTKVASVRFDPTGATLLSVSDSGEVRLLDVFRDELLADEALSSGGYHAIKTRVDPSGTVAAVSTSQRFLVLDLRTGAVLTHGPDRAGDFTLGLDRAHVSVAQDDAVDVKRLSDGVALGRRPLEGCRVHRPLPDGKHVVLGACAGGHIRLIELATGRRVWSRPGPVDLEDQRLAMADDRILGLVGGDLVDIAHDRRLARDVQQFALAADRRLAIVHHDGRGVLALSAGSGSSTIQLGPGSRLYLHLRARPDGRGCHWLLADARGLLEGGGDVAAFFRLRRLSDLRSAPLEDPVPVVTPRLREGLYREHAAR